MPTETELKLALAPAARRLLARHPLLAQAAPLGTLRLRNIYFDTPELALRRRGIALRLRKQGRRWLQTVKCAGDAAGGLSARPEWEQPYDGARFDFGAIDDDRLRRFLERRRIVEALAPVFETGFARRLWRLTPAPGVSIELACDSGTIVSGQRSEPICEIELELEGDDAGALLALGRQLARELPLKPEALSKAERGYLLFNGERPAPRRAAPSPVAADDTPLQALRRIVLSCIEQLQANERGALETQDPEYIHQMRVALRRIRSALRVFGALLPEHATDDLRERLGRLAGALGAARDWDVVVADVLGPVLKAFPEDERLLRLQAAAGQRRDAAREQARAALLDAEYGRALIELMCVLHEVTAPASQAAQPSLPEFAQSRLRRLGRRVARAAEASAELDIGALHALRIALKRLRYALEFFAPLYPDKAVRRQLRRMAQLQQDLGLINDLASAGPRLEACARDDVALREAVALVGGWYGPRYRELTARLPKDTRALVEGKPAWRA